MERVQSSVSYHAYAETMRKRGTHSLLAPLAACILAGLPVCSSAHAQSPTVKVPQNAEDCEVMFVSFLAAIDSRSAREQTQLLRDEGLIHIIPQMCKDGQYQAVYDRLILFLAPAGGPPQQQGCVPGSLLCDK